MASAERIELSETKQTMPVEQVFALARQHLRRKELLTDKTIAKLLADAVKK